MMNGMETVLCTRFEYKMCYNDKQQSMFCRSFCKKLFSHALEMSNVLLAQPYQPQVMHTRPHCIVLFKCEV